MKKAFNLKTFLTDNSVVLLFLVLSIACIPASGYTIPWLIGQIVTRLARNSFLVLSLLIPIWTGMGLNFGMVLGAMAGQIGLILVIDWGIGGIYGIALASILGVPVSLLLGWVCGEVMNRARGREMVTGYILGFFINGIYQFVVLYCMGIALPILSKNLVLSRGYGIRNTVDLEMIKGLDTVLEIRIGNDISIPVVTFGIIALLCLFIYWFTKTKLGQDMRAVGQDMNIAESSGIPVQRTRIIAIVISTVLACFGQILFLQNIGTLNTYNSHDQIGLFSIAAILVGGASAARASITNVFIGTTLLHLVFIVVPMAFNNLTGQAMMGEYISKFLNYAVIAVSLVLYAWRKLKQDQAAREDLRIQDTKPETTKEVKA